MYARVHKCVSTPEKRKNKEKTQRSTLTAVNWGLRTTTRDGLLLYVFLNARYFLRQTRIAFIAMGKVVT